MRTAIFRALVVALALAFGVSLHAQDVASITGLVTDSSGAVVPGVSVTLENPSTSASYKGVTNSEGSYTIQNVQPGPGYKITFTGEGFKSVVITGLYLNVNATRTQNAKLSVGGASQTVEVSAAADTVTLNTTDATVGNNFQVQDLNNLPIANRDSPAALFTQQPGVTLDGAVTGARTDQNNVTVDGLEVNDNATGQFQAIVATAPVDSVQEFRGVTAGELSSAGQGGGGQFDLVTRSGTNKFHGALVEYHRDTDLEANDWFNNNAGVGRPPLIRNQFGGNVGGPIKRDKGFFFFDLNSRRDTISSLVERSVPMDSLRNGEVSYCNNTSVPGQSCNISTLSSAQVQALDPQSVGFNSALQSLFTSRYPEPNDFAHADGINYAGFRFNYPTPYKENDYVGRVDWNLTGSQKVWGRVTFARVDSTQSPIQFPGDPVTHPFQDRSRAWVAGHTWTIGSNKVNQASYGEVYEDYQFPDTYNKTGANQFVFGTLPSGGNFLSAAYSSAINAQGRTYPIPVIRDDFTWQKGKHSFAFGGTFKYENPQSYTYLNYNSPGVGMGGHLSSLNASLRPSDIATDSTSLASYDAAFAFGLGRYSSVSSTFNYDNQGQLKAQGTGSRDHYRYYETELYFGDTWKLTPSFTISYGVRWQNYSVPYEVNGIESVPDLSFDQLFNARIAQSAAGAMGPSTDCNATVGAGVPCVSYLLGGKANNGPGYFNPQYTNFAPRLAFAWMPSADQKSVFSGGAGIIYDHTVVNAVQYQASQYSYLFQASATLPFGTTGDPRGSLLNDPRFGGLDSDPPIPTAPAAIQAPYTPFVENGVPLGLANGQAFNEGVDKNLKTPYSIGYNFGFQHEFPGRLLLKTTYVGRLGRRLLGQTDAEQLIEFTDPVSGQTMSQAFGALAQQIRSNPTQYLQNDPDSVTPQPWFENVLGPGIYQYFGSASNTAIISDYLGIYAYRGDFADTMQALSGAGILPDNVGMGSQFSEFTYYTNKGFSGYNGMLVTLHKNTSQGLTFDLNYTFSHSIDNVSVVANAPAIGGYGFICDALRPRLCRGNSDFDVTNEINGNFAWDLPIGRGKAIAGNANRLADEIVGGWSLSGLPSWHTGNVFFANSSAFVAGYSNSAPAILTGPAGDMKMNLHKDGLNRLFGFKNEESTLNDFVGPIGFQVGTRNQFRGPQYFNIDLGLGKTFPIWPEKVNLKFRADAFNALNHPSFDTPNNDITETSTTFGQIESTVANPSGFTARVLQLALRLEF